VLAAVAAGAAALGAAAWLYLDARRAAVPDIGGGYVLVQARELPAVELVAENGAPFRPSAFAGHWSLLYFGYTYCPDVCPLTLVTLAALKRQLAEEGFTEALEYYLVSVDPNRDTPARLAEYVAYFDPDFRGLTGSSDALASLAAATETLFDVPEGEAGDNYLVSHSSNLVLLDPNGRVHAVFTPPHDRATLAGDLTKIVTRFARTR
jgi:protein SCO1/2